jgi:hypothetical protein
VTEEMSRASAFEQLARKLNEAEDEATRLEIASRAAVSLVDGCDHAGVTVNEDGHPLTRAASDDLVRRANELQYELREGPCLDTIRDAETLVCTDLARDERWPSWAPRVHRELGAGSMMSLLLYTEKRSYGALSLYGDTDHAFDAGDLASAQVLAGHLAVLMDAGREIHHRGLAMQSRTVIGQAQGILMERFDLSADQAFAYLRRLSSDRERKLADVAADIARTRQVPDQLS